MDCTAQDRAKQAIRAYKVEDIAAMLQIGRASAYKLINAGHFKTVHIGNSIRVSRKSFEEWLEQTDK